MSNKRAAVRACLAACILALTGAALPVLSGAALPVVFGPAHPNTLEINFLDVGQGDAALVTSPDGRRMLVDGGPRGSGVAGYLRRRGIDTLDLIVASHNHADHIGGLREVLGAVVVRNYMENGLPSATATYTRLVDALARSGARVLDASARTLTIGQMTVQVLPPPPGANTQNDRSVGLLVEFGDFRALFAGDAEQRTLAHWLEENRIPESAVVKVSHHGSWNGTTPGFVNATRPSVAVISVGASNRYGHPSPVALRLWNVGAHYVLRTDRHGTITVHGSADGGMRVSTARGAPRLRDVPKSARSAMSALEGKR